MAPRPPGTSFTGTDDYESIVSHVGYPEASRSRPADDGRTLYLLRYPDRGFTVVLAGGDRSHAFYMGAVGRGGRVVSIILPNGQKFDGLPDSLALSRFRRGG